MMHKEPGCLTHINSYIKDQISTNEALGYVFEIWPALKFEVLKLLGKVEICYYGIKMCVYIISLHSRSENLATLWVFIIYHKKFEKWHFFQQNSNFDCVGEGRKFFNFDMLSVISFKR